MNMYFGSLFLFIVLWSIISPWFCLFYCCNAKYHNGSTQLVVSCSSENLYSLKYHVLYSFEDFQLVLCHIQRMHLIIINISFIGVFSLRSLICILVLSICYVKNIYFYRNDKNFDLNVLLIYVKTIFVHQIY